MNLQTKPMILELGWTLLQNLMEAIGAQFHSDVVGPVALAVVSMVYLCTLSSRRAVHVIFLFRLPSYV